MVHDTIVDIIVVGCNESQKKDRGMLWGVCLVLSLCGWVGVGGYYCGVESGWVDWCVEVRCRVM